jgi:type I restriction enzyme S subunit
MYLGETIDIEKLLLLDLEEKEFLKNKVEYGDIFFTRSSIVKEGIAHSRVFLNKADDVTYDGHLIKMSPNNTIGNSHYLAYLFKTDTLRRQFVMRGKTTTMTTIGQEDIASVVNVIPSLPEQQKIASFLSAVDKKIEKLTRKKELLEQYKKGVMQKIFSQEIRFKDENGKDFPDWSKNIFGALVEKSKSKYNPKIDDKDYACIELENIAKGQGVLLNSLSSKNQKSVKNRFSCGEVLFGKLRPNLKKYLLAPFDGVCSSEIWIFRGKKLLNQYLFFLIQTNKFYRASNVTFGSKMPRSDWEYISSIPFLTPTISEQKKIANFLSTIDKKTQAVQIQLTQTQLFKKGLLQKMFV